MTDDARSRWQPPDQAGGRLRGAGGGEPPVLDQVFDGDSLYSLRAAVAAHASQAGMAEGRARDLVLAMHELAANAVRHGAGRGRLRLWVTEDAVRCEVTDDGASKAADGADAGRRGSAPWPVEFGHGLWLTRQVADQASWSSGPSGTVAAVSFRLGPPGQLTPFRLAQQFQDGCAILAVTGQLDLGSASQLAAAAGDLIAATPGLRLVLDLSGLTMWDSSGLTALITAQRWISGDAAARMVLAGLPGHLVQRLHEAGVASRFTLAGTNADAVRMAVQPG
jgi:anti-anti-sigma factor